MTVEELLVSGRDGVVGRWFDAVADTYPEVTSGMLRAGPDQFANPLSGTLRRGLSDVFDQLIAGNPDPESLRAGLDRVIRIRSVQSFTPSAAVGFVFRLRGIVREAVAGVPVTGMEEFEGRLDAMALAAFDVYTRCREDLHEIRAGEIRKWARMTAAGAVEAGRR